MISGGYIRPKLPENINVCNSINYPVFLTDETPENLAQLFFIKTDIRYEEKFNF